MTKRAYIANELSGRGYRNFEDIPDELFDYLPENLDNEDETDFTITAGANDPLFIY